MGDIRTRFMIQDDASSTLQKIASAGKQAESSLKQAGQSADKAFKTTGINAFKSAVENALRSISADFESLGVDVDKMLDDFAQGFEEGFAEGFSDGLDEAADSAKEVGDAAKQAGKDMDAAAKDADEFGENVKDAGKGSDGIKEVGDSARDAGESLSNAGTKALSFSDAIKGIVTAVAGLKALKELKDFTMDAVNLGIDYTAMMSEVQAISGASTQEMSRLEATAREYGATTVFSAKESAEALKYMSLAGWDASQSASALGGVLDLAAASGMGLGESSDMVTDYLSAFGMEANQATYFADMLAYAQSNSNTSARQLGEAYLNSAANLHSAGQDIETTTSMLEAMANQGTKGSRAGTQLAAIMRDITNEMENGAIKIGDTTVAVADENGAFRDLTDIMKDVETAVGGMESAERAAALATTFTADSTKGLNQILTEGVDKIAGYEEELRRSGGAAGDAADTMNDNLKGDLASMNSAWEEFKLQIFEGLEGPLREGAQYITGTVIPALTSWVPQIFGSVADEIGKIANAVKPMLETVLKNPKAVASAFAGIGTGLAVFKGINVASSIMNAAKSTTELTGGLGGLYRAISTHPWAAGAAAVAGGILLIKSAVDTYNDMKIEEGLTRHFGNIDLSDSEIAEMAGKVANVEWVANINLALGEFENAQEFHDEAEEKLKDNEKLMWLASVQTTLERAQGEEDPSAGFAETIQGLLTDRQTDSGLTFDGNVGTTLKPNEDTSALTGQIVQAINLALSDNSPDGLDDFSAEVMTQLNPADPEGTAAAFHGLVNGIVAGAPKETLDPYVDTILANLSAEDGGTFLESLSGVTAEILSQELEPKPEKEETVSIKFTVEQQDQFKSNIQEYLKLKQEELDSLTFAAKESIEGVMGDKAGSALISRMQEWAADDSADLSALSSSLTALVEDALSDGVLDVNEQAAIEILQQKVNNILSGWKKNEANAKWNALETKWSGANLTYDSWSEVVSDARTTRQAAFESLQTDTEAMYEMFEAWNESGKITAGEYTGLYNAWEQNYRNREAESMISSLGFENNTLSGLYGDLITENLGRISSMGGKETMKFLEGWANENSENSWNLIADKLWDNREFLSKHSNGDLNKAYGQMKDDVTAMQTLIDKYVENGQDVPEQLMSAFNQAIDIGAAAGDADAAWQKYANAILESGNDNLISALTDPGNEMYSAIREQIPEEMANALDRATWAAEHSTDSFDLSALFNGLLGNTSPVDLDLGKVQELCEKYGVDISEYLSSVGIDVDGADMKINYKDFDPAKAAELSGLKAVGEGLVGNKAVTQYQVEQGQTLSEIARNAGFGDDWQTFWQEYNPQIENPNEIEIGQLINVPKEKVEINDEGVAEAVEEAADEIKQTGQEAADQADPQIEGEIEEDAHVEPGEVEGAEDAAELLGNEAKEKMEESDPEPADQTIPASIIIALESLDDEALQTGIDEALADREKAIPITVPADVKVEKTSDNIADFRGSIGEDLLSAFHEANFPADGQVDVTLEKASDNIVEVYSQVGGEIQSAFNSAYTAYGKVNVILTADYSLANPSTTITFGGGATGSAMVTASVGHAEGGIFDTPHYGVFAEAGPEAFIPLDGSSNSIELWKQAGEMLGVMDSPLSISPKGFGGNESQGGSHSRDINLNINGHGTIQVNGNGVSREQVAEILAERLRPVLLDLIEQEVFEEGDGTYDY